MANSSIVSDMKTKIITELIHDEALFHAIGSPDITDFSHAGELLNTHLFSYAQSPETLNRPITFLTFQVHIPKTYGNNTWVGLSLEITVISHESCMNIDDIPEISVPETSSNRNDRIAELLDRKFNGRTSLGIDTDENRLPLWGALDLTGSTEGFLSPSYLYRKLTFETRDLNDSLCDGGRYAVE